MGNAPVLTRDDGALQEPQRVRLRCRADPLRPRVSAADRQSRPVMPTPAGPATACHRLRRREGIFTMSRRTYVSAFTVDRCDPAQVPRVVRRVAHLRPGQALRRSEDAGQHRVRGEVRLRLRHDLTRVERAWAVRGQERRPAVSHCAARTGAAPDVDSP